MSENSFPMGTLWDLLWINSAKRSRKKYLKCRGVHNALCIALILSDDCENKLMFCP